jgi:hypothetical protein
MKRFDDYMKHFSDVEGWFQTSAIAIWDSLLSYQQEQGFSGNLLEIGVGRESPLPWQRCTARVTMPAFLLMPCRWRKRKHASAKSRLESLATICRSNRNFSPAILSFLRAPAHFAGFTWTENTAGSR